MVVVDAGGRESLPSFPASCLVTMAAFYQIEFFGGGAGKHLHSTDPFKMTELADASIYVTISSNHLRNSSQRQLFSNTTSDHTTELGALRRRVIVS